MSSKKLLEKLIELRVSKAELSAKSSLSITTLHNILLNKQTSKDTDRKILKVFNSVTNEILEILINE